MEFASGFNVTDKEEPKKEENKVTPVVKGGTSIKKKSNARKFAESFIQQDVRLIKEYLIFDVILPGTKRIVSDMGHSFIDMLFYGGEGSRYRSRDRYGESGARIRQWSPERESYNRYYDDRERDRHNNNSSKSSSRLSRGGFSVEDIEFEDRWDAEQVLLKLRDTIEQFGLVSVATYYEFCRIDSDNYMDNKYGWFDIVNPRIETETNGKAVLYLPKPVLLN